MRTAVAAGSGLLLPACSAAARQIHFHSIKTMVRAGRLARRVGPGHAQTGHRAARAKATGDVLSPDFLLEASRARRRHYDLCSTCSAAPLRGKSNNPRYESVRKCIGADIRRQQRHQPGILGPGLQRRCPALPSRQYLGWGGIGKAVANLRDVAEAQHAPPLEDTQACARRRKSCSEERKASDTRRGQRSRRRSGIVPAGSIMLPAPAGHSISAVRSRPRLAEPPAWRSRNKDPLAAIPSTFAIGLLGDSDPAEVSTCSAYR